ncbi:uncharacterized protein LOC110027492 isoform X2 [Phalaenopsis equestris]|uniref:uncharacterized protein LOC110027492 isoform X2 n=1 Tax=Phalaenopsis equestris TaxID=78828 RepID=UPI0009E2B403|nr:uncharacterized protein LOC110027492 isoform X2 [Phalaenopsis equestris]
MSLLLPSQPVTVSTSVPRVPLLNALVHSAHFPSRRTHLRRRSILLLAGFSSSQLSPAVCLHKPFECSFNLPNPFPFVTVSAGFVYVCSFLGILPSDFSDRWNYLVEISSGSEKKVKTLPYHLIQAVLASEDRRFFYHFGFDPFGIGRAVVFYPNGGGGSTITQQLAKNIFLTSERKISRKIVEGILSLILERKFSKWEILYAYLNKMYWGHGNYGIEAASSFYFGKHPSMLHVGESALLSGILPGPESLNPISNPKKGKDSQARALRRMVDVGFLDLEIALDIVKQPLCLVNSFDVQGVKK